MNVGAFLTKAARAHPARVAVTDGTTELRYAELDARAAAFADGLRRSGYAAGDRVVIFMPNRPEYLIAMFGLFKGGLVAVPVNAKLHFTELAFILEHSGARAVVFSARTREAVGGALASVAGVERIDVDGDWASGDPSGFADAEVDPDDPAWLFYTSGTTGPEGRDALASEPVARRDERLADVCDFQPEDVVLHLAPLRTGPGSTCSRRSRGRRKPHLRPAELSMPPTCWRRPGARA